MKGIKITQYFLVAVVLAFIFFDGAIIFKYGKDASISQVLIDYSYSYPVGVLAIGIVLGHLFWRMPDRKCPNCGYKK